MIVYHVFGKANKEKYFFISGCDSLISYRPRNWDLHPYEINLDTTSDDIFKDIKNEAYGIWNNYNNTVTTIPEIYLYINKSNRQLLLRKCCFTGVYKEFTTIDTDIELRDGETIHIDGRDYTIEYKFNADKEQHELFINKVVETIVDKELLKHARKVCDEVIKMIIRHNRELYKSNNEDNNIVAEKECIKKDVETKQVIKDSKSINESEGIFLGCIVVLLAFIGLPLIVAVLCGM